MLLDLRPAWIRQADELRHLVEGLTDGIVTRAVEHRHDAIAHVVDRRMAAGDDQAEKTLRKRCRRPLEIQIRREEVALAANGRNQRGAPTPGPPLRPGRTPRSRA